MDYQCVNIENIRVKFLKKATYELFSSIRHEYIYENQWLWIES